MSLAVCLSLVANLRCSGLTPQQSRGILIPPAVEALFISFLIYTERNKGRKHFLLLFDSYIFLSLCILDFISKANDAISTSITIFPIVDRVVGGVSGFSIVFYTLFLYLFARRHFILILPPRFQWSVKVLLTVLVPVILILVELGSLLGYTYVTLPPSSELAVRFNTSLAKTLWTLLNSAGLVLLVLYQFVNFCLSIFRIFRYFYHSSPSPGSPVLEAKGRSRKTTREQPVRIRGVGWIAAGIKLGAIEVLLGFVPNGFGMSLSRRLFRLVGRLMLAWGVYQGIDDSPGSTMFRVGSIDSIEGLPPRRIPINPAALRTLIGAPVTETFAKMSPTATAFHTRKKVPDAMAGISAFDMSFVDEKSGRVGEPSKLRNVVPSGPTPAVAVRNLVVPTGGSPNPYGFGRASANYGKPGVDAGKLYPDRPTFPKLKQADKRVTVAYDGLQAPVLDIRFSSQVFPDAGKLIGRLGKHSPSGSTDHSSERPALSRSQTAPAPSAPRARSMPPAKLKAASKEDSQSQSTTSPSSTQDSKPKELLPMSRTANNGTRGRSRSASTKSVPTLYNPFADPPVPPGLVHSNSQETTTTTSSSSGRKRTGSTVSEDSLSAIRQLSMKFPPLPSGASPTRTGDASVKMLPRKRVPDETSGPNNASERPSVRQRSYSSPRLQSESKMESDPFQPPSRPETSPRSSLDRDVAIRTRRRLPAHLHHLSSGTAKTTGELEGPSSGKWSGHNSNQWASGSPNATTVNSTATSLFSTPVVGKHNQNSKSIGGGRIEDILASPITDFSRDSAYSNDDMLSPLSGDRPMGRIARRALGIEQFLDEEKEKWGASQESHELKQSDALSPPPPRRDANAAQQQPVPGSRIRPRSNLDTPLIKPPPPRRGMTVEDPDAREAFAAAWRTVVPKLASPSVSDLKTVNSVSAKRTPAPSRHRAVFSGDSMQSMRVDEGSMGPLSPGFTPKGRVIRRADETTKTQRSKDTMEPDREFVKKSRLVKVASMDSEVY